MWVFFYKRRRIVSFCTSKGALIIAPCVDGKTKEKIDVRRYVLFAYYLLSKTSKSLNAISYSLFMDLINAFLSW